MKKNPFRYISVILLVILLSTACQKEEGVVQPRQEKYENIGNLLVVKDPQTESSNRISFMQKRLTLKKDGWTRDLKSAQDLPDVDYTKNYVFTLMGEVSSPVFEGNILQATHVDIVDHVAFVSYNTRGSMWLGGFEIFDVSDIKNPSLIASVVMPDADVSSIAYSDGKVYIVGAMGQFEANDFESPAFLEVIQLDESMNVSSVDTIIDISSYVGTDVLVSLDNIYITSGSDGHLTVLSKDYTPVSKLELQNARSIDTDAEKAYVLQGQPGRIQVVGLNNYTPMDEYTPGGANTPDSKSEIAVNEKYIFAALNEGGLAVLHKNGISKQHIPSPVPPENGLVENNVTNSVTVNHDLVLIGNGESGVHVGAMIDEQQDSIWMLGAMQFEGSASTNFVESRDSVLFVATGMEGFKIISIGIDHGLPDDINPTEPCESLLCDIAAQFPETKNARKKHPGLFTENTELTIKITEETNLFLTFIDEGAGWKNTFGYYSYPADNPPQSIHDIDHHIIFPNVSKTGEGGALNYGDQVQLGTETFPAGTVVGFYLVAKGWENGATGEGIYTHYTNPSFNIDGAQQSTLFVIKGCDEVILTFEDKSLSAPNCDSDYNDIVLMIKDNPEVDIPNTRIDLSGIPVK